MVRWRSRGIYFLNALSLRRGRAWQFGAEIPRMMIEAWATKRGSCRVQVRGSFKRIVQTTLLAAHYPLLMFNRLVLCFFYALSLRNDMCWLLCIAVFFMNNKETDCYSPFF